MVINALKRTGRIIHAVLREKAKSLRSPKWAGVRRKHLKDHPTCAACSSKRLPQVHHITPFSDRPELELDPTNLITLCMSKNECHLMIGHGHNFRFFNPNVVPNAAMVKADIKLLKAIYIQALRDRKDKP